MKKRRYGPRALSESAPHRFRNAEEAWFWFIRAQRVRREGLRFSGSGMMSRPCESDDIYLIASNLKRAGILRIWHLRTLLEFGARECPPDGRLRSEEKARRLWDEALDRMSTVLRHKGIIE